MRRFLDTVYIIGSATEVKVGAKNRAPWVLATGGCRRGFPTIPSLGSESEEGLCPCLETFGSFVSNWRSTDAFLKFLNVSNCRV